jgi:hypothetical protein
MRRTAKAAADQGCNTGGKGARIEAYLAVLVGRPGGLVEAVAVNTLDAATDAAARGLRFGRCKRLRDAALAGVQAGEDVASLVELTAVAWKRVADGLEKLGDSRAGVVVDGCAADDGDRLRDDDEDTREALDEREAEVLVVLAVIKFDRQQ